MRASIFEYNLYLLGLQKRIFAIIDVIFHVLSIFVHSLLDSSFIAPWYETLIYLKIEYRLHFVVKWSLYLLVQNLCLG